MNRQIRNRLTYFSAGLAALGGAALAVSQSRHALQRLPRNHVGGRQKRFFAYGYELFVTELGAGKPIILIHGVYAGASSYEFRFLAQLLAASHRVIVFDFLGCGLSDHPEIDFSAATFVEQITLIVKEYTDEPVVLIGSSYSAVFAVRAAALLGSRIRAIVALSPSGMATANHAVPFWRSFGEVLLKAPILGEGAYAALISDASLRSYLKRIYADPSLVTPEMIDHYRATSLVPGGKSVVAAFVGGALECEITGDLPFLDTPILILKGDAAQIGNDDTDTIAALGNNVECRTFPDCGMLPQEECPQSTSDSILAFLSRMENTEERAL